LKPPDLSNSFPALLNKSFTRGAKNKYPPTANTAKIAIVIAVYNWYVYKNSYFCQELNFGIFNIAGIAV